MGILGTVLAAIPATDALKFLLEFEPLIEEAIQFGERQHDDKLRAASMDSITRGLQYAKETGDTSQLEQAIKDHCGPDGCRIP